MSYEKYITIGAGVASILSFLIALGSFLKSKKNEKDITRISNKIDYQEDNSVSQKVQGDGNITAGGNLNAGGSISTRGKSE